MAPQNPNADDADLGDVQQGDAELGDVTSGDVAPPPPPPAPGRPGLMQRGIQFVATQAPEFLGGAGEVVQQVMTHPYGVSQGVRPPVDIQHPPPAPWQQWNMPKSAGEFAKRLFGPWKDEATGFLDELTGVTDARAGRKARGWGKFTANLALLLYGGVEQARRGGRGGGPGGGPTPTPEEKAIFAATDESDLDELPESVQSFLLGDNSVRDQAYSDLMEWSKKNRSSRLAVATAQARAAAQAEETTPSRAGLLQRGARVALGVSGRQMKRRVAAVVEENRKITAANEQREQDAAQANREAQAKHDQEVEDFNRENLRKQMNAEEKNAQAKADYDEAVANIEKIRKDAEETATRHGQLSQTHLDEGGELVGQISAAEKRMGGELNQSYRQVDKTVGNRSTAIEPLTRSVETAEQIDLAGSEENIRQFRSILRRAQTSAELDAARSYIMENVDTFGGKSYNELNAANRGLADMLVAEEMRRRGAQAETTNIGYRDLRGYVSEIDKVLREQGGKGPHKLNGDIQQGLKRVLTQARTMSETLADEAGVGDLLRSTNRRYGQYIRTFHTPAGKFGSPLAKTLEALKRAPDVPDYAIGPLGKVERIAEIRKMLQNFAPDSVALFDRFVETNRELADIKVPKVPTQEETAEKIAGVKAPKVITVEEGKRPKPPEITRPDLAETTKIGPTEFRKLQDLGYDERIKQIEKWGTWAIPLIGIHVLQALVHGDISAAVGRLYEIPAYLLSQQAFLAFVDTDPVRNFVMGFNADDAKIMETIPPEYRREAADNLGRVIDTIQKNPNRYAQKWGTGGKAVQISPALMAFVHLYRTRDQKDRQKIMDQGRDLTATPFQQQQR